MNAIPTRLRAIPTRAAILLVISLLPAHTVLAQPNPAAENPDPKPWSVSLNGIWQFAAPDSQEFQPAKVPRLWTETPQAQAVGGKVAIEWKTATYRREFQVPAGMSGAVVEFDQLRWGGQVLANGQSAGTYDLGWSPVAFDLSAFIKAGANQLDVKPRGWPVIERFEGKHVQIPIGAGNWFGPKAGGIPDDVVLRFHRGARIDLLRVTPHIAGPSCDLATRVIAGPDGWKGRLAVQVLSDDGSRAVSGARRVDITAKAGEAVDAAIAGIDCPGAELWSPEKPVMYRIVVWLENADGSTAAVREDAFGLREVAMKDGHFLLNNRRIALFGATEFTRMDLLDDPKALNIFQAKLFRGMNAIVFRPHQNPLTRGWMDFCDRNGILIMLEFPNFPDVQRQDGQSPYLVPHYWENLQREIRGMIAGRFNHPSIVGWVASNEGTTFGDWEHDNLEPFVKSVDRTRLAMFSGDVTPDVADQHNFAGLWWGTQAESVRSIEELARHYPDRITGCTEYGQYSGGKRWYGAIDKPEDPQVMQDDLSRILMEQTEAMRRSRFGMIMPFSYGWHGKKAMDSGNIADGAPPYQALRNALSRLGVSIDFRRHAVAGTTIDVPLWTMSDAEEARGKTQATLYLLDKNPGYNWSGDAAALNVLAKASYAIDLVPWQAVHQDVKIALPKGDGQYWLAATVGTPDAPPQAISLRELRAYAPLPPAKTPLVVGLIERDGRLEHWLTSRGHKVVLPYASPKPDVILVAEGMLYDERMHTHGGPLTTRTRQGARLVVLEQHIWDAAVLQSDLRGPLAGITTSGQATMLENLFPEAALAKAVGPAINFQRLNGVDNCALRVPLGLSTPATTQPAPSATQPQPARLIPDAPAAQVATTQPSDWTGLLLGYGRGNTPGWAVAHRVFEQGDVYACQMPITDRVCTDNVVDFDPVAERLLAYLVEEGTKQK